MNENEQKTEENDVKAWFNTNKLAVLLVVITGALLLLFVPFSSDDFQLFMTKLSDLTMVFFFYALFNVFFLTRKVKTDEIIQKDPIAVAIVVGSCILGFAWAIGKV